MNIILSDKILTENVFPTDVKIEYIKHSSIDKYNHNPHVIAIAGSRAIAIKAAEMDLAGLRLFQLTSAGFDGVPCTKYTEKNIMLANAGSVYNVPIAETVVFGMLSIAKKIHNNPNNRRFKIQRNYNTITELAGKQILVMGAGNIGTAVANRLLGFEVLIDGYDPYCGEKKEYIHMIKTREELMEQLAKYDYIVSTMPDNKYTQGFIDSELFNKMKQTAVMINVGRRTVFNEDDFYHALKTKAIGGAVLDMFEKIPNPISNKFRRLSNVIVLPGVAAISHEVDMRLREHMTSNLLALLNRTEMKNVINMKANV